ncbi:heparinase II/III domain-containing protein [Microlunatus speluncae]|uniref:heparinase II/III domain-containing protein n=1 Tax=Microlunatus speluncae TaxID=2594267 RepID=UPI0012665712|nr:heparinase II/III family protein [Microlunatus speluncae]
MISTQDSWDHDQLRAEVERRGATALAATELPVDYYRIGYRLTWPLPVAARPDRFPAPIPGIPQYPWLVWLGWQLEERWADLINAGHHDRLLAELILLDGWSSFVADDGRAGLVTACLARWLSRGRGLAAGADDHAVAARLTKIADRLITDSLLPRYRAERDDPPADELRALQNIRLIPLFSAGRLAAELDHPGLAEIREQADGAVRLWLDARRTGYTEGVGYDGYLIDHLLEWLAAAPDPAASAEIHRAARSWVATTVPGRPGIQAPIGDIEPEMTQWLTVIARIAGATQDHDLAAWCRTVPLTELPAAALTAIGSWPESCWATPPEPGPGTSPGLMIGCVRQQSVLALRSRLGDQPGDDQLLVAVSTPRVEVGHLHHDAGHVVIGWRGTCWLTDPGYQQYRAGEERTFTLDERAHNVPVIDSVAQHRRRADVRRSTDTAAVIELSACYPDEPAVRRTVRIDALMIMVRDEIEPAAGVDVRTHWLVPRQVAWQFVDGWARLSDGAGSVVWFGCGTVAISPDQLIRQAGSRGQLTLTVPTTTGRTDWFIALDPAAGWQPPERSAFANSIMKEEQ